ncbi:MAG: aa3-type cytochrome c oxidase subunit IV [Alphaproteobacteria bacterium]|jgi:hypothetical protein|nr:aa3-type cytochrome c oxidase subunit IV [Alphaproteobacteria bacterium]
MAAADYTRGEMDITTQERTWDGFIKFSVWSGFITILAVAYMTLTLATGMHWLIALVLCAGSGLVGGLLMGMGGAWIATVIGLSALAIFIQIVIAISRALIPA